jgi:hypothetical protein
LCRQRLHPFGARLFQEIGGRRRPAPGCAPAEFSETLGCLLTVCGLVWAEQGHAEDFAVFCLGRASMLGGADAEAADDIFVEVPDCQGRHGDRSPVCWHPQQ